MKIRTILKKVNKTIKKRLKKMEMKKINQMNWENNKNFQILIKS